MMMMIIIIIVYLYIGETGTKNLRGLEATRLGSCRLPRLGFGLIRLLSGWLLGREWSLSFAGIAKQIR
jgi:hypothetical protein